MTHVYDPGRWSQELAFWPSENQVGGTGRAVLVQRLGELLAHLARWARQEGNQCLLWHRLITLQRQRIARMLEAEPGLRATLADPPCLRDAWLECLLKVIGEVNCFTLPDDCPWTIEQVLSQDYFPS